MIINLSRMLFNNPEEPLLLRTITLLEWKYSQRESPLEQDKETVLFHQ
jgi:hypothetical protein